MTLPFVLSELISSFLSRRNNLRDQCPTVKWSGIQNVLEESQSDVLVLLNCCASGMSNTDEGEERFESPQIKLNLQMIQCAGNGVTELIAACAFNNTANGVGPFSFTYALISQLRRLVGLPPFTVGYLDYLLFAEIQSWRLEDARHKKASVHLVLTQDHRPLRSITISAKRSSIQPQIQWSPPSSQSANPLPDEQASSQLNVLQSHKSSPSLSPSALARNHATSSVTSSLKIPNTLDFSSQHPHQRRPQTYGTPPGTVCRLAFNVANCTQWRLALEASQRCSWSRCPLRYSGSFLQILPFRC